jgi:hypothetical protein
VGIPQLFAGVQYYVDVVGFDAWNNSQTGITPGFRFGTGEPCMPQLFTTASYSPDQQKVFGVECYMPEWDMPGHSGPLIDPAQLADQISLNLTAGY